MVKTPFCDLLLTIQCHILQGFVGTDGFVDLSIMKRSSILRLFLVHIKRK